MAENICNSPTILSPNGGEVVFSRSVTIQWHSPDPHSDIGAPIWYELFFVDAYDDIRKNDWVQVASIPAGSNSFVWNIPFSVKSKRCRFAIRCRDHRGIRSSLSISAGDFTIQDKQLSTPAVTSPEEGQLYRFFVPFVLNHTGISNTHSQRSYYQVFYSSQSQNIDWTPVRQNISIGDEPFHWDTRDLAAANDYSFKVTLLDDEGNSSVPVFINNITISPLNMFWLDTTPPKGTVQVQNNAEFTNERDLIIKLTAFDETTGVQSITLQQREGDSVSTLGSEQEMSNIKTWFITGTDGIKFIEANFKDFANNVIDAETGEKSFRTFLENENKVIDGFLVTLDGTTIQVWTAFGGSSPELFLNQTRFASLPGELSSIIVFDDAIHLATKTSDNKGTLSKILLSEISELHAFTEADSIIESMDVFSDVLYLGLENGKLYQFNGTAMTFLKDFGKSVRAMHSDGTLLYIFLDNTEDVVDIFDGVNFTTASVANANQQI